jgi:phage terminase large subunit-like protein
VTPPLTVEVVLDVRRRLVIDVDGQPVPFCQVAQPWQEADLLAVEPAWLRAMGWLADGGKGRAYLERPRGSSKTGDLALLAAWALALARRPVRGVAAAADQDQAKLLHQAIARLVQLNPLLDYDRRFQGGARGLLQVMAEKVVNPHNGSELTFITSDVASSYGHLLDFLVCDELVHWRARPLWDSLISAVAKRRHAVAVVISNAGLGKGESWQWQVREACRQDPGWHFSRLEGPPPWIGPERLAEQRRLLPPQVYARLWDNVWSAGGGDALDEGVIRRALTCAGPMVPEPGWLFFGGLDIGITNDASALVVVGKHVGFCEEGPEEERPLPSGLAAMVDLGWLDPPEREERPLRVVEATGRYRLASVQVWRQGHGRKVSLAALEEASREAWRRFNLAALDVDSWQAHHMVENLRRQGFNAKVQEPTGCQLRAGCAAVMEEFGEGRVDLFPDPDLLRDLANARIEERQYGLRLTSPRDAAGHGDALSAFTLALTLARRMQAAPATVNRELLCWP